MYVLIGVVYALGAVGSWVCMVGWEYAYVQRKFPLIAKQDEQKDWRDACIIIGGDSGMYIKRDVILAALDALAGKKGTR